MPEFFAEHPGRLYVVATLLPLFPAAVLLLVMLTRDLTRPHANNGGAAGRVYGWLNRPSVDLAGAWLSIGVMGIISAIAVYGLATLVIDFHFTPKPPVIVAFGAPPLDNDVLLWQSNADAGQMDWIRFGPTPLPNPDYADFKHHSLPLGYWVDETTLTLFVMVSLIGTMICLFSIGYMSGELSPGAATPTGHPIQAGGFARFYLFLNIFVVAMFNLLIADNLLQLFISWEIMGACSYFLISFYQGRREAGWAANKAFIANRIGDVGFLIAIAIAWSETNTLLIGALDFTDYAEPLWSPTMQTLFGLGLFLGCVGKSAQFPLQVWLPDAMAGPTPVSALIHAATMVAAGVYLVARCYALFTPEVFLVIAYTGCITLFVAATAACVQTDIKKVLAYSTVSQLGFMMLALGVGGWAAGVFHLLTHAFFKALLFLSAGSVIHGLHHEQDLRKMGGLRRKMPITAYTMLVGVLAISGFPLLSGWYSKEAILTQAAIAGLGGLEVGGPVDAVLGIVPFLAAGLTAFYMLRLWLLTFAGEPRDESIYRHAHESPWVMTVPLVILAMFSVALGWGWPVWEPDASYLYNYLHYDVQPTIDGGPTVFDDVDPVAYVHDYHLVLELAAGGIALVGFAVAYWRYALRTPTFADATEPTGFFARGWYFDALYDFTIRRPTQKLATLAAAVDKASPDAPSVRSLDGMLNSVGRFASVSGTALRSLQTGRVRGYVAILGLTVVGVLGMLAVLTR